MLTVDNVHLYYGASHALRGVSLEARKGKVTCVLGRNGVGKTSLLRAILGLEPVRSGQDRLGRRRARRQGALRARARRHRQRAAGPRDLPAALGAREPAHRFAAAPRDQRTIPEQVFELFPVLRAC